jgi:hypothetical protein
VTPARHKARNFGEALVVRAISLLMGDGDECGVMVNNDSTLSWKIHIEQIIPKLSSACYAMRSVKPFMLQETLKMVYYAYFHSIVNYGLIL